MKVNTIGLNSVRLNTIALNHIGLIRSGGGGSKPSPIPQWIREHISFYYDMSKPMDVYPDDFSKWTKSADCTFNVTSTNITITNFKNLKATSVYLAAKSNFKGMKIRVSGLVDGQELYWGYWNNSILRIPSNGDYTLSPIEQTAENLGVRSGNIVGDCNITIEMLPSGKSVPTNEILKVSGYLQDLSGRKRNMKLNNFLFAEMSGVGGYNDNFLKWNSPSPYGNVEKLSSSEVVIKSLLGVQKGVLYIDLSVKAVHIKCHITGITKEIEGKFVFQYNKRGNKHIILKNGDFEFDSESLSLGSENGWTGFTTLEVIDNCNITITQIPEYPGALVTDGVDDYGLVENLSSGVKMLFMTVNPIGDFNISKMYYSQRKDPIRIDPFYIFTMGNNNIAYAGNSSGVTYINGVLNKSIKYNELFGVKHTITTVNANVKPETSKAPSFFWEDINTRDCFSKLAFYNSIAFDSIPTEADRFTEQELIDYVLTNIIGQ